MPFTEFEFYKKDYIKELSQKVDNIEYKRYFAKVMNCTYGIINKTQRVYNLDEINLLFEKFYPQTRLVKSSSNSQITCYYMNLLSKITKSFICHRNGKIAMKYWESNGEEDLIGPYKGINKVILWNSLNRMLVTDILVVRYLLDNGMKNEVYLNGYYYNIMLEDLQLEQILKRGIAETHIHKGAGINFYISWQDLMTLTGKKEEDYKRELFSDSVIGKEYGLEQYVMAMAIVRIVMANFLVYYEKTKSVNGNFLEYLKDVYKSIEQKSKENLDYLLLELIEKVYQGNCVHNDNFHFFALWERLKEQIGIIPDPNVQRKSFDEDLLTKIFENTKSIQTAQENIFLFKSMRYLDDKVDDEYFSKVFWQYIRIKNEVFQLKVQGNFIKGLLNFVQYFERSTHLESYPPKEYWKLILQNQFQNTHLKKLELRSGFGKSNSVDKIKYYLKNTLINFLEAYLAILDEFCLLSEDPITLLRDYKEAPLVGLVFHMIKVSDWAVPEKCWQNYCSMEQSEIYFQEIQDKYMRQVQALNELREEIPELAEYILGIDAASVENNTEPWVFAPVYEAARDGKTHKILYSNSDTLSRVKNLGFTFHVGEDFRHLITGIRRVDEVIEHFKFHAGDRIGHGIALGINIDKWIANNQIVVLPRLEHLENLLWVWGMYKDGKYTRCFDSSYLEQRILQLAQKIYIHMDGITVYALWKAYRRKFKSFVLEEQYKKVTKRKNNKLFCNFVNITDAEIWNEHKLYCSYHCQVYLERMLEPIQVEIGKQDREIIKQIQSIVAGKVSKEGIVVETNPSSNVAIGEVNHIFDHYIHNLNQIVHDLEAGPENTVMISINSDDPSVFNTNVSNELAYIFYSLQEKGYSREDALLWIDKVRRYGMESSFIDDRGLSTSQRYMEIKSLLHKLRFH